SHAERDDQEQPEPDAPERDGAQQDDQCCRTGNDAAGDAEREQLLERDLALGRQMVVMVMSVMVVPIVVMTVVGWIVGMAVLMRFGVALEEKTEAQHSDREP